MFPLEFPYRSLHRAKKNDWVLDPFCGRGTTSYAARLRGNPSVGIDSNPVAVAMARAKLCNVSSDQVISRYNEIAAEKPHPKSTPVGVFWKLCYHHKTLNELCAVREWFCERTKLSAADVVIRALILGFMHGPKSKVVPSYLSNQMPRTYATKPDAAVRFWRNSGDHPNYVSLADLLARRARYVLAKVPPQVDGYIIRGDSRTTNIDQTFNWVVTSPPYLGMRTYWSDQWLRNWFMGGPEKVEYARKHQIQQQEPGVFAQELAKVWANTAKYCAPGAGLIIRFGALPTYDVDIVELLKTSLSISMSGWSVKTIRSAGNASHGNRQADHFATGAGSAIDEFDLFARFEP